MNKFTVAILLVGLSVVAANPDVNVHNKIGFKANTPTTSLLTYQTPYLIRAAPGALGEVSKIKPQLDLCPLCVQFMGEALQGLIQIILNGGVLGSCSALCGQLPSKVEATVCNLLCDYVGITEFIKLLNDVDPDPIFICESIRVCSVCKGAAKVDSVQVAPASGPQGSTFDIEVAFTVENKTCTGEIAVSIQPPDAMPFGSAQLSTGIKPGSYGVKFQLQAQPSQQEPFSPGTYQVGFALCEGTCGSKHPNSAILAQGSGSFKITGQ
eukprot:TRINITY_DN1237_c0_g1_i1.p1 TRINITY_DN1237_c0_g1~~TRINITY_DN1237_c0_g1_i1.p1  ORF type:complete len:267 (+),score=77.61 TRINITY_DN1237_c0_g1_i1:199-999(+)